jgi:nitrous oxidase accessory protein NosD
MLLLVAAIAASGSARAQVCGATLYASVALTADLVCPAGVDGLVIGANNLRIDLNGYAIASPNSAGTRGVRSSGFSGIKIVGPGTITGFDTSVLIDGGTYHEIRDVDAADVSTAGARIGFWLRNMSRSVVERSRTGILQLGSDPGRSARANRITHNDADSIHLHGCQTDGNEISNNDIHPATQFMAVKLYGAMFTQVIANRIVTGTVWLGGSSGNVVSDNIIDNSLYPSWIHAGVIMGEDLSLCGALVPSTGNLLQGNAIIGGQVGVLMRAGSLKNTLVGNKIFDQRAMGLQFFPGSDDNDARGNGYANAPVQVVDLGHGNLWP